MHTDCWSAAVAQAGRGIACSPVSHSLEIHHAMTCFWPPMRQGTRKGSTMNWSCLWRRWRVLEQYGSLGWCDESKVCSNSETPRNGFRNHLQLFWPECLKVFQIFNVFVKSFKCWRVVGWVCRAKDGFLSTQDIVLFNVHGQKALFWRQQVKDS